MLVPGECVVLVDSPEACSPARRLRDLAKSQDSRDVTLRRLIVLLDDRRPTRSWSGALDGTHVLRYCDVALEILADVAGVNIPASGGRNTFDPRTLRTLEIPITQCVRR